MFFTYREKNHERVLKDSNKLVSEATGPLAALFRKILRDQGINNYRFGLLVNAYLDDPRNGIPKNGKDRSSTRGNLQKEVFRPSMTFKVFRKALLLLAPDEIELIVKLKWGNGHTTAHSVIMDNSLTDIEAEDLLESANQLPEPPELVEYRKPVIRTMADEWS